METRIPREKSQKPAPRRKKWAPKKSEESSVTKRSHIVDDASQQVENVMDLEGIFDMCRLSLESISILVSSD
ncbi:uncharacterized protein APUU_40133S [Aspergillus puulaauensis]|uniref:Uncharacterized protein n=1 Tax=Aspergillus puulaauensis TaxID=1220207 RepID=A0A7R7XLX7_9EURO|nr:uncharacterized protein APUU_40133S [Aspergillus puulaauensis]BCS23689.1 hypothetical protein APUU_40133S [Aspergillus puulaauensis]